jgi:hypothetical protein
MYVVITTRVVRMPTGSVAQFSPRQVNSIRLTVSGPFRTFAAAQKACVLTLGSHTCLGAQTWSAEQVETEKDKGYSRNGSERQDMLDEASKLISLAKEGVS